MNQFITSQIDNSISFTKSFIVSCEMGALKDDGKIDKEEQKILSKIRKASQAYIKELEIRGSSCSPIWLHLRGVEHIQHEADTLAQRDEADRHRQHHRKQCNDFVQNTRYHIRRYNGAESSRCGFLHCHLFNRILPCGWLRELESNQYL